MKLIEAVRMLKQPAAADAAPMDVYLACGFTPLHLTTFLTAHIRLRLPDRGVTVRSGTYGDCIGNIERMTAAAPEAGVVVIEWSDLDPRLGVRQLGGWGPRVLDDVVRTATMVVDELYGAVRTAAAACPVVVCLPTLPWPPIVHIPGVQAGAAELAVAAAVARLGVALSGLPGVRVVGSQRLDQLSPRAERRDAAAELATGFPYQLEHADRLATVLAALVMPAAPKKGLITDLDDVLWRGILGDVGPDHVAWDLDNHAQVHGLYQQQLRALADTGALIAVASKNDRELVDQAMLREDLLIRTEHFFPMEVHWQPKSGSIERILRAWNIGARDAVFVDDSPLELAEVQRAHPELTCLRFPTHDVPACLVLLEELRDLLGKQNVTEDDLLRRDSLRHAVRLSSAADSGTRDPAVAEQLLAELAPRMKFRFSPDAADARAFELVNKTNQFNLNGVRFTEGQWRASLERPGAFLMRAAYEDKFGQLGTISVAAGRRDGDALLVNSWVLSCRAFSRRIEYQCLAQLFEQFPVSEIQFDFHATERNGPLRDFLAEVLGTAPRPGVRLARADFDNRCPALFHHIEKMPDA
jgi:FkbH-like protein